MFSRDAFTESVFSPPFINQSIALWGTNGDASNKTKVSTKVTNNYVITYVCIHQLDLKRGLPVTFTRKHSHSSTLSSTLAFCDRVWSFTFTIQYPAAVGCEHVIQSRHSRLTFFTLRKLVAELYGTVRKESRGASLNLRLYGTIKRTRFRWSRVSRKLSHSRVSAELMEIFGKRRHTKFTRERHPSPNHIYGYYIEVNTKNGRFFN